MKLPVNKKSIKKLAKVKVFFGLAIVVIVGALTILLLSRYQEVSTQVSVLQVLNMELGEENETLKRQLADNLIEVEELKNRDEYQININLQARINEIEKTYTRAVSTYEELLKLKENTDETDEFDDSFTAALVALAEQDYESAASSLADLSSKIASEQAAIVASFTIPVSVPVNNTPPGSGYSRQTVDTDIGQYLVSLVAADLGSTRVIVDTASSGDCGNECPVLSLGEYVSRNGAYAGVNGSYFCPASYPSCAGKTNTFDLLVMNKDKTYFNSDNNVYSTNPAVIFGSGYIRFVSAVSEWGRDTGVDGVLSNFPLLVFNSQNVFAGDNDPKKGSKAGRSFVANKGNTVYIGVVHSSTVAEAGKVLHTMGMENALNLDSGGSTALYSGGYKVGPGRNLPNAILFVAK